MGNPSWLHGRMHAAASGSFPLAMLGDMSEKDFIAATTL
jgi:hypothetical protein